MVGLDGRRLEGVKGWGRELKAWMVGGGGEGCEVKGGREGGRWGDERGRVGVGGGV